MHSPAVPAVLSRMRNEGVISTCLGCRVLGTHVAGPGPLAATMTHGTGRSTNVLEAMWATVDTSNASHMRLREVHMFMIFVESKGNPGCPNAGSPYMGDRTGYSTGHIYHRMCAAHDRYCQMYKQDPCMMCSYRECQGPQAHESVQNE